MCHGGVAGETRSCPGGGRDAAVWFVEALIKDIPERKEVEWVAGNAEA